jgi:hypothetical protein
MVRIGSTPGDSHELRAAWGVEGKRVLLTVERIAACERYQRLDRVSAAIPILIRSESEAKAKARRLVLPFQHYGTIANFYHNDPDLSTQEPVHN